MRLSTHTSRHLWEEGPYSKTKTPIQDAAEPSSSLAVLKCRLLGMSLIFPLAWCPKNVLPHQRGDKESAQRGQARGVSCSPCQHRDPPAHSPGIEGQEPKFPMDVESQLGGLHILRPAPHGCPNSQTLPPCRASCCLQAKEFCAGTQPSSSSSSHSRPGQSHPHHCALDKLPFKGVCLIPYLPSVRSRSSCRRGRGGRDCRALLSYELFLTHVYNFHKSFLQRGERKKGGGEGGRGRRSSSLRQKPLARWAGREGSSREGEDGIQPGIPGRGRREKQEECRDTHPRRGARRRLPESDFTLAAFVLCRHFPCSDCISFLPAPLEKAACLRRRSPD